MNHLNLLSHFKMMMKEGNEFVEVSGEQYGFKLDNHKGYYLDYD